MGHKRRKTPAKPAPAPSNVRTDAGTPRLARILETAAFFALLLVVAIRPLMTETYDSALNPIDQSVGLPPNLPATTAMFDMMIWLSAAAAATSFMLRRVRWQWSGLHLGGIVLAIAAVISSLSAGNERLAFNASADWLAALVMVIVLANLVRTRLHLALLLSVVVASGTVSAAKCIMQTQLEFAETLADYEQNKERFWEQQGVALDDPQVELFERRMAAREASGFFPFSNVQGAGLNLAGFAALAMLSLTRPKSVGRMSLCLVALILFTLILATGSKGALLAAMVGLVLWWAMTSRPAWLQPRWGRVFLTAWIVVLIGAASVICIGLVRGGLPGSSLNFRWQYWQVTTRLIGDHPWAGTGALNFDREYLAYKPIEYPEEIKDPHNFALSILAQWGILGGAGLALLLIGATRTLAKNWSSPEPLPEKDAAQMRTGPPITRWTLALLAGFFLLRLWVQREWLIDSPGSQAMLFFDLGFYGLLWGIALSIYLYFATTGQCSGTRLSRMALLGGAVAFLLHSTIGFAFFFPGTLVPFAAIVGAILAKSGTSPTAKRQIVPLAVSLIGLLITGWFVAIPVGRADSHLSFARRSSPPSAARHYTAAILADPRDPTPHVELAGLLAGQGKLEAVDQAIDHVQNAIRLDPRRVWLHRFASQLWEMRFQISRSPADLDNAIAAARRCLTLFPDSPDYHLVLADLLARAADKMNKPDLANQAINHYRSALELDCARPGTDEARRWPDERRSRIEERMHQLKRSANTQPE